jgi:hypothetical protein
MGQILDRARESRMRSLLADGSWQVRGRILAILDHADGTRERFETRNLVTTAGDLWYAQKWAGEAPTNTFANCVLGTGAVTPAKSSTYTNITPIAASNKAVSSTYPKRNDSDADNTGSGVAVITWRFAWAAGDFNQASGITEGVITIGAPTTGSPLLAFWQFSPSFGKDGSTTLTLFVNHTFVGT